MPRIPVALILLLSVAATGVLSLLVMLAEADLAHAGFPERQDLGRSAHGRELRREVDVIRHPTRKDTRMAHLSLMQRVGTALVAIACFGAALVLMASG